MGHTGSVTLLRDDNACILIDTGARGTYGQLKEAIESHNLRCEDISIIVLTHFHLDHCFNAPLFPWAKIVGWMHEWKEGEAFRYSDIEQLRLLDGASILRTPGHSPEHLAVVVEDAGKTIVMTGDAVNEHYARTGEINVSFYDELIYRQSADHLLNIADEIIPGHGERFLVSSHKR